MVRPYEAVVVLSPALESDEAVEALIGRLEKIIADGGGVIRNLERWGRRRLAYPIKHQSDGYYVLVQFDAEVGVARELDRVLRITDAALRHLVVRRQAQVAAAAEAAQVGEGRGQATDG